MKKSLLLCWQYLTFLYWKPYYLFYKPKNKSEIIKKWARLDYYDFKELKMSTPLFDEKDMKGLPTNDNK